MGKEWLQKLKPGDKVIRLIGNKVPVEMIVRKVEGGLIYCEASDAPGWADEELWTFEQLTGIEYDPDLHWGSKWGATGSYLIEGAPHGTATH
jgi:hypothetical protein